MADESDAALAAVAAETVRTLRAIGVKEGEEFLIEVLAYAARQTLKQFSDMAADAHWLLLAALEDSDDPARRVAFKAVMDRLPVNPETLAAAQERTREWYYGNKYQMREDPILIDEPVQRASEQEPRTWAADTLKNRRQRLPSPYVGPAFFHHGDCCGVAFVQPPRSDGSQAIWPCLKVDKHEGDHEFQEVLGASLHELRPLASGMIKAGTLLLSRDAEGFYHVNPLAHDVSCETLKVTL